MLQFIETTEVTCTNANPRTELHGDEKVRAIDLSFKLTGENHLLDMIEQGLREHHFCNHAAETGQVELPDVLIPLPNIRHPKLPQSHAYAGKEKCRGYRWVWDWGTEGAHVALEDVVLTSIKYDLAEGGSTTVYFTIQYNGPELEDNAVYGDLCGMAAIGQVFIQLFAPPEMVPVKKKYRAGRPETTEPTEGSGHAGDGNLFESGGDDTEDDVLPAGSPEAALAGTADQVH